MNDTIVEIKQQDILEYIEWATERTVRELLKKGTIKSKKIAGKYITTRCLLKAYIEGDSTGGS